MNSTTLKLHLAFLLAVLSIFSGTTFASEYIFRDLMGNTLPSSRCADKSAASANASEEYNLNKFSKRFCETQGYGWYVSEKKSDGKLVCEECSGDNNQGKYQCHVEDVVVTCKRLKPGSAGLIPGKG